MIKMMKKFGGAIMLYAVIFFGIVAIVSRVSYMNEGNAINEEMIAINK